jgi:surfeit locus 1 family protein
MARWLFLTAIVTGIAIFTALGVWQIERRAWKLDLIERVEARVDATPIAAPGPDAWGRLTRSEDEYRRVVLQGRYLDDRETLVKAVTELGAGYWVLTPFRANGGFTVLVNRGYVPPNRTDPESRVAGQIEGETRVVGLLRMSEPGGGFLRANDPGADRWYSRDVAAIAAARGLSGIAPYFIDAARSGGDWPRGGLTVVRFRNSHLVYAITWFCLAVLLAACLPWVVREPRRDGP